MRRIALWPCCVGPNLREKRRICSTCAPKCQLARGAPRHEWGRPEGKRERHRPGPYGGGGDAAAGVGPEDVVEPGPGGRGETHDDRGDDADPPPRRSPAPAAAD